MQGRHTMPRWIDGTKKGLAALAIAAVLCAAAPASAAPQQSALRQAGLGLGAVAASLLYTPAKLLYAAAGGLLGVGAYAVTGGRTDIMQSILDPSLRGDYVVTPEHLTGERSLVFKGSPPEDRDDDPYAQ